MTSSPVSLWANRRQPWIFLHCWRLIVEFVNSRQVDPPSLPLIDHTKLPNEVSSLNGRLEVRDVLTSHMINLLTNGGFVCCFLRMNFCFRDWRFQGDAPF
jgi:hypothetical protein